MKEHQIHTSPFKFTFILLILLFTACKKNDHVIRFNSLPDLPAEIAERLDIVKMTTAPPLTFTPPPSTVKPTDLCCALTTQRTLKVSYSFTKCAPFSFFLPSAVEGEVFFDTDQETNNMTLLYINQNLKTEFYKFKKVDSKTPSAEMIICMTSNGPWNASLTEVNPCAGGKSFSLTISAFDEIVQNNWSGSINGHLPEIGLVNCQLNSRFGTACGISSCTCQSFVCQEEDICSCAIEPIW